MNARQRPGRSTLPEGARTRGGFSLTELLVVIGIIVLLVGLLLAALGTARGKARHSQAESTMRGFAQACETFQMEQGAYPGVIPETVLAQNQGVMTSTENAILALMGGYRLLPPGAGQQTQDAYDAFGTADACCTTVELVLGDWKLKVDVNRLGEGPIVEGKPFAPYFTPSGREVAAVEGQDGEPHDVLCPSQECPARGLPDLIDAWGQPVIYARRVRTVGQLAGDASSSQYTLVGTEGYLQSTALGRVAANQVYNAGNNPGGSILSDASPLNNPGDCGSNNTIRDCNFWKLIEHPALAGQARGAFALFSAGDDGIFFSGKDGPAETNDAYIDLEAFFGDGGSHAAFDDFDDVRIFGGG